MQPQHPIMPVLPEQHEAGLSVNYSYWHPPRSPRWD